MKSHSHSHSHIEPEQRPDRIGIIGAGAAGLITAHTLLKDGFSNLQLITRDSSVGGVWSRERIYPGLTLNNVHGEFRFSSLPMPPPTIPGGRLSGEEMCNYMEAFAESMKLDDKILFRTEVWGISRGRKGKGTWVVNVENLDTGVHEYLEFDRLVVCTGGCSSPRVPANLSTTAVQQAQFKGLVLHSSEFSSRVGDILKKVKPSVEGKGQTIVVVGGGKSAQDIAAYLANQGRKVTSVFDTLDAFLGTPIALPAFIRKSRFLPILSPHIELRTRLERFLHGTWLGSKIVHFIWDKITQTGFDTFKIPPTSPLRKTHSLFWAIRTNDEGAGRPGDYYKLVNEGVIDVVAPAHVDGYTPEGVKLNDGRCVDADVVILCTGYGSSWSRIFDASTAKELGIDRHPAIAAVKKYDEWDYPSLANPPQVRAERKGGEEDMWMSEIYRGLVPAKNIARRDFAVNGAIFSTNNGYTYEVASHWISAYFMNEPMRLPATTNDAIFEATRNAAWMRKRYPGIMDWANESYSAALPFWNWPQAADELLDDLYLPSLRSGGNWLTWPFKTMDLREIEGLTDERRRKRKRAAMT